MGTLIGHVAPGLGFALIGLWHLLNAIRSYLLSPLEFQSRAWFPVPSRRFRHAELYLIIFSSALSIASELFIFPDKHQPFADGGLSIPFVHLNNFEHSSMSLFFLIYATFALISSRRSFHLPKGFLHLLAALAFSQELLLFHLHSADHMGLEGQYHWLLQLIIVVCLACSLLEIVYPSSFLVVLVRSMGILFQGLWFIQMGLVLWIPRFVPSGCRMNHHDGHDVVKCMDERSSMRAKALANLQFNLYLAGVTVFSVGVFVFMSVRASERIPVNHPYVKVGVGEVEMGASKHRNTDSNSSIDIEDGFPALELER